MLELDGTLIIAIISFIVFALIMNEVLYKPIMKILDERNALLKQNAIETDNADKETVEIIEKKKSIISSVKNDASRKVSEKSDQLKQEQKAASDEYSKIQKQRINDEKQNFQQDAEQVKGTLIADSEGLADLIEEKILGGRNV